MIVNGSVHMKVDIEPSECLRVVLSELGYCEDTEDYGYIILESTDPKNKTGKKGLFRWSNIAYHGSPRLEYKYITDDKLTIKKFELALQLIEVFKEEN